ncbi:MAG: hypothetical protein GQ474_10655, partial [Sulfurimonas sp.]|nr:hypothetical protein [Sulfurimonas sp.]
MKEIIMLSKHQELKNISEILLNKASEHFELLEATKALSSFFERYSAVSTHMTHSSTVADTQHSFLASGVAISPLDAAIC